MKYSNYSLKLGPVLNGQFSIFHTMVDLADGEESITDVPWKGAMKAVSAECEEDIVP